MLALDVARIEAGLLLIDVDFASSKKALIESQKYSPFEMGLGRLVNLDKARFVGQAALAAEKRRGPARTIVGLEIDWTSVEALYDRDRPRAAGAGRGVARRRARLRPAAARSARRRRAPGRRR